MTSRVSERELNDAHTGHTLRSDEALKQYGIRRRMRLSSAQVKGQSLVIFVEQHFTATINRKQLILEGNGRDDLHPRCTWPAHLPVPLRSPVNILQAEPRFRCRTLHVCVQNVYSINNKFVGVAVCVTFAVGILPWKSNNYNKYFNFRKTVSPLFSLSHTKHTINLSFTLNMEPAWHINGTVSQQFHAATHLVRYTH